ncbi:MAG: hypothetical protein JW943_14680 [Deltaproteobacteria bacterium]|nr:hypothetical protein [Deltaproteobacteria bacterium]
MNAVFQIVITGLLTINLFMLGIIMKRIDRIEDCLENKVDQDDCDKQHGRQDTTNRNLWDAIDLHSHEGLPAGSRVTRGR